MSGKNNQDDQINVEDTAEKNSQGGHLKVEDTSGQNAQGGHLEVEDVARRNPQCGQLEVDDAAVHFHAGQLEAEDEPRQNLQCGHLEVDDAAYHSNKGGQLELVGEAGQNLRLSPLQAARLFAEKHLPDLDKVYTQHNASKTFSVNCFHPSRIKY